MTRLKVAENVFARLEAHALSYGLDSEVGVFTGGGGKAASWLLAHGTGQEHRQSLILRAGERDREVARIGVAEGGEA